jgi:hypothetical protein
MDEESVLPILIVALLSFIMVLWYRRRRARKMNQWK